MDHLPFLCRSNYMVLVLIAAAVAFPDIFPVAAIRIVIIHGYFLQDAINKSLFLKRSAAIVIIGKQKSKR